MATSAMPKAGNTLPGRNPNGSAAVPFSVNLTELDLTPALGLMVVTQDNKNGKDEANLVKIEVKR